MSICPHGRILQAIYNNIMLNDGSWIDQELSGCKFKDARLGK